MSHIESFPFDASVHLHAPPLTDSQLPRLQELKERMKSDGDYDELWCTDHVLTLFLIARSFDVDAAHQMMSSAREWRKMRRAHLVELQPNWETLMKKEGETGKIYCPGMYIMLYYHIILPFY